MRALIALVFAIGLAGAATAAPRGQGQDGTSPKAVVLAFYELALNERKPGEAFARYAAPDFVEHKATSAGSTSKATVELLERLLGRFPQAKWQIVRTVAEGDLVFLHVRFLSAPGARETAVGDIFRVRDGKLVEHWDIIQDAPEAPVNSVSMF